MFGVSYLDRRFHPKEQVLGVELNGAAKAYPFSVLSRGPAQVVDQLGGKTIRIVFDTAHRTGRVYSGDMLIPSTTGFWFAWAAFHPDTEVYKPYQQPGRDLNKKSGGDLAPPCLTHNRIFRYGDFLTMTTNSALRIATPLLAVPVSLKEPAPICKPGFI